jgi:cell division protease FtsH
MSATRRFFAVMSPNRSALLRLAEEVNFCGVTWLVYMALFGVVLYFVWRASTRGPATGLLTFGKSRPKIADASAPRVVFDDVAGVDEAKEEVREVVGFLSNPDRYHRLGARIPRGVLLVGPPGTGKTLLARAVAGEANVPFLSINGSEFVEMIVGVGAARVRDLFRRASENAPCILFIDELDALGRSRGSSITSNEEREQALNQLLVEMDGFSPQQAVVVIAATNRPEVLDPALLRPGRFDRQVLVDVPDRSGRRAILAVHAKRVPLAEDIDLETLAARTPGFAGADLANLVNEAAILAARRELALVDMACFSDAIDRVVAGLEKKNRLLNEDEKRRVAYHEVGHALAGVLAGGDDEVHKISIVPRALGALGFTMQLPIEEKHLMTARALRAKMVGLLGGRAAEEVVFGDPSTGAQNDLERATDVARAMVIDWGMSDEVGPVSVSGRRRPQFLAGKDGAPVTLSREVGESLADTIDREVRRLVDEALGTARELLRENREALDRIAERLLESEVLEGEELQAMLREAREAHAARIC